MIVLLFIFFSESAERFADYLDLSGDEHILDVATGTGNCAFGIAKHLPNGKVTAVDFSKGMLKAADEKKASAKIFNVEFIEMDMEDLNFDAVLCGFAIFFVEDMISQLRDMSRTVKREGVVLISTFHENHLMPLVEIFFNRLSVYGVEIPKCF